VSGECHSISGSSFDTTDNNTTETNPQPEARHNNLLLNGKEQQAPCMGFQSRSFVSTSAWELRKSPTVPPRDSTRLYMETSASTTHYGVI